MQIEKCAIRYFILRTTSLMCVPLPQKSQLILYILAYPCECLRRLHAVLLRHSFILPPER